MSEEAKTGTKGVAAGVAERRMLRAQEHKENEQKEHTSMLEEISSMMSDVQSSFRPAQTREQRQRSRKHCSGCLT